MAVVALALSFVYVGEVMGQPRPHFSGKGGIHRAYESPKATAYKKALKDAYLEQCGPFMYSCEPVSVTIEVVRHLPDNRPKGIKSEPDTLKPDVDNIAKAVLDALNGVAFADDKQVTTLLVREYPRVRLAGNKDRLRVTVAHEVNLIYSYAWTAAERG